jgi:threonine/homoserine/homoserine lactone efflux protein
MLDGVGTAIAGAIFGLALAAPPGPMNALIAEESVMRGWAAGAKAGLGAMTADAVFFVLALFGVVAFVERFPTVRATMVGVGGLLMLYFAYGALGEFDASFRPAPVAEGSEREIPDESAGFRKAFVLALANPYQVLFWLTIGVGLLRPGRVDVLGHAPYVGADLAGVLVVETGSPTLIVGFFAGIGLWIVGFPAALATAAHRVEALTPVVTALSALVLGGFGVAFLVDAATTLL